MILRDYQIAAIDAVRAHIRQGTRRVCVVAPTGAGKTVIAGEIMSSIVAKGRRALFLAHRRELIDQPCALLEALGIGHARIQAGHPEDRDAPIQVASVQTIVRRAKPPADVVIVDECHHVRATSYTTILEEYPDSVILGLTATPWRRDGRGLGTVMDALVGVATVRELCDAGHLVEPIVYAGSSPDVSGIRMRAGEYESDALEAAANRPELVGDLVANWSRICGGVRTVVYCCSIAHAEAVAESYVSAGVRAAVLSGATPADERASILARLRDHEIDVVANCEVLTEGWDLPALGCVQLARPTGSLALYLQMVGRVMRPAEGKPSAIVLDHGGCVTRWGLPTDDREWTLDDRCKARPRSVAPCACPECGAIRRPGEPCPACGWIPSPKQRIPELHAAELERVTSRPPDPLACTRCGSSDVSRRPLRHAPWSVRVECHSCHRQTWADDRRAALAAGEDGLRAEAARLGAIVAARNLPAAWAERKLRRLWGDLASTVIGDAK